MLELIDVYKTKTAPKILYRLLKEREAPVNISHRQTPSMKHHLGFIKSKPYKTWDLIAVNNQVIGATYLSRQNEIGLFIFKKYRNFGYGRQAVRLLLDKHLHTDRFLANINPWNKRSIHFFEQLGFHHIQNTYELRRRE